MLNYSPNSALANSKLFGNGSLLTVFSSVKFSDVYNLFHSKFCASLIAPLFCWGGPSAIGFRIIAVGIDAINGMELAWCAANVGEKIYVGLQPNFTNLYSTQAIILKIFIFRIITTFFHSHPSFILFCSLASIGISFSVCFSCFYHKEIIQRTVAINRRSYLLLRA